MKQNDLPCADKIKLTVKSNLNRQTFGLHSQMVYTQTEGVGVAAVAPRVRYVQFSLVVLPHSIITGKKNTLTLHQLKNI